LPLQVRGTWEGWLGNTIVRLSDGSVWRQAEYHYEYHYAYMPKATIIDGKMSVDGMKKPVRVMPHYG